MSGFYYKLGKVGSSFCSSVNVESSISHLQFEFIIAPLG